MMPIRYTLAIPFMALWLAGMVLYAVGSLGTSTVLGRAYGTRWPDGPV